MTWTDAIALTTGVATALLITTHQHRQNRSTTRTPHPRRTAVSYTHLTLPTILLV